MDAKELMLGDLVQGFIPDTYSKIVGILNESRIAVFGGGAYIELSINDIQPIPLTPEILEKNGFTKSERFEVWKIISDDYELRITPWRVAVIFLDEDGTDKEEFSAPRPKYVHDLQHALRICGIEKEINMN